MQVKKHRNRCGTMDWFKIRQGVNQCCVLSLCLFNLYAEYIVRNAGLDESQAGTRLPGEISTTSDMQMTLMAESEEELKKNLA